MKQRLIIIFTAVTLVAMIAPFLKEVVFPKKAEVWTAYTINNDVLDKKVTADIHPSLEVCTASLKRNLAIHKTANQNYSPAMVCGLNCKDNGSLKICDTTKEIT